MLTLEQTPKLVYIEIRGPLSEVRDLGFRVVPGFRGLTSWGAKTYAVFAKEPEQQDKNRLHQLAGGLPV